MAGVRAGGDDLTAAAIRRLSGLKPGKPAAIVTSDLSVNEFVLVHEVGFRPVGMVLGSAIHHVGIQLRRWSADQELTTLSRAMYLARDAAMSRMQAEASALGAHGVVGVRLTVEPRAFGEDVVEFLAVGTAVKADNPPPGGGQWRNAEGKPFTSDLSGQDFWTLVRAGYAPLGMVMGTCVYHVAHRKAGAALSTLGRNAEIGEYTRALYEARELAMARMQAEAAQLGAEGVVGVHLDAYGHRWGGHTTEFFSTGTAVRPLRPGHRIGRPALVLDLDG
ncbi:heavy metal-binding domain-containing protein [Streptomyces sp. V4-01]|uniref:Heavy metal-binding domain-containing protein n=1 Tax=Actinacidiphila polyblastidii TaxID=3110430 RepID=A0ABU7PAB9_9ACTN|nr:heavy metal-binding domain-containing protein [Streptomyces sp. V4-01]